MLKLNVSYFPHHCVLSPIKLVSHSQILANAFFFLACGLKLLVVAKTEEWLVVDCGKFGGGEERERNGEVGWWW